MPDQRRTGNSQCPTAPEITIPPHLFRILLIGRLQLPRQLAAAACQDARVLWTSWGFMHTDRQGTATSRSHRAHERHRSILGSRHIQIVAQNRPCRNRKRISNTSFKLSWSTFSQQLTTKSLWSFSRVRIDGVRGRSCPCSRSANVTLTKTRER